MKDEFNIQEPIMLYEEGEYMKRNIKANKLLRVLLDDNLQDLKGLPKSRERSIAITKLQETIMWLGMDLKRLGEEEKV